MASAPGASQFEPPSTVERLFLTLVESDGACDAARLEALCAERPELAGDLRELARRHAHGRGLVGELAGADGAAADVELAFTERYAVLGEIARGGMGVVLEVWDAKLRRTLAMKALRPAGVGPLNGVLLERRRARLVNEAQVLAQLEHPGIVPVHDIGRDDRGELYFTMLRVRGQGLDRVFARVRERDGWSLTRALGVLLRVCEAVAYAHEKGVLHRDLKPANVMVGAFGEAYVMDWGLARTRDASEASRSSQPRASARGGSTRADAQAGPPDGGTLVRTDRSDQRAGDSSSLLLTQEGDVVGTPAYMAPEQARGTAGELDARSDVYSLGAMLYELLAGAAPYERELGDSPASAVLAASRERAPRRLDQLAPRAPAELAAICDKAMARQREARYATVAELADDLRAYLEGRVVKAHRRGAWIELQKWVRRNKGAAAAITAVIVGLGATATVESLLRQDIQRAQSETAARAEDLRRQSYFNGVALAAAALKEGKSGRMRELLDACPADLHGWEWRFLDARVDTSDLAIETAPDMNRSAVFGPDEGSIVTLGALALAQYDAQSGALVRELEAFELIPVAALSLSGDRSRLLLMDRERRLRTWDTATWAPLPDLTVGVPDSWPNACWSPASDLVAVHGDGPLEIWDMGTRTLVTTLDTGQDHVVAAWSGDGTRLYTGAWDGSVAAWDMRTFTRTHLAREHGDRVNDIAASPDGRWLATAGWERRVFVWDARTLVIVHRSPALAPGALAWSPDSSSLAAGAGPSIVLLEAGTWIERCRLNGHDGQVASIAFDRAGERVVSTSVDGDLRVWDLRRDDRRRSAGTTRADCQAPRFSRDGQWLMVPWWKERLIELWSVPERRLVRGLRFERPPYAADLAPDGQRLLYVDTSSSVAVVDPWAERRVGAIEGVSVGYGAYNDSYVRFSPDGARISIVGTDGSLGVWDAGTLERLWQVQATSGSFLWPYLLSGGCWSPDGRWIATLPNDGRIQVWDAASGALLREWRGRGPWSQRALFSADGRRLFVAGMTTKGLECWDVETGTCVWEQERESAEVLALDHAGKRLFCVQNDVEVRDGTSGTLMVSLELDDLLQYGFAASPAEDLVVTASKHGLAFWDTRRPR